MRLLLLASLLAAMASPAAARPAATAMTCAEAQALVASEGAVVMSTGPNTYERFVATPAQCTRGEVLRGGWAATLDDPTCRVGNVCRFRFRFPREGRF